MSNLGSLFRRTAPRLTTSTVARDETTAPFSDPNLVVQYRSQTDDLSIEDSSCLRDGRPASDIGEDAARTLAQKAIADMASKAIITPGNYDTTDLAPAHLRRTEYAGDGKDPIDYVVEYRFRTLRRLNGIEVANNGVVVGITPKAELSSIRVGGVQFDTVASGGTERPTASGAMVARTVSHEYAKARFAYEAGRAGANKQMHWSKIMYVMPEGQQEAVIEPMLITRFSNVGSGNGGKTIPGRGQVIGISLTNASAELVKF